MISHQGQPSSVKRIWEADLNQSFTDSEWMMILRNSKKMSRELRTRLVQFKIINRVYWTPTRLFRAGLRESPFCWRCGEDTGTLIHVLWECPRVQTLWCAIHENIMQITGQDIPYTPALFILGDPSPLKHLSTPLADWIHTALMVGRKIIVKEWKSEDLPPAHVWFTQLGTVAALERLSFKMNNQLDKYDL